MAKRRITTWLHGCNDHNADLYATYDLPDTVDFNNGFAYQFDEMECIADVDLETGEVEIVAVRYGKQTLRPVGIVNG